MRKYKSLMATIMEDIYPIHEKYQYFSESVEHIGEMVGKDVKVKLRRKGHEYTEKGKVTKVDGDYLIVKHDFSNRPSKVHKRDVIEETQLDDSLVDAVRAVLSGQPTETQEDIVRKADVKMVKVKLPDGRIVMRRERPTIEIGKGKNESLDPVDQKALKGKYKDRKDKDIDNDGDVDSSDKYLHMRRKAVAKAVAKEEVELDEVGGAAFGGTIDKIQKVVDDKTAMKIDGVMVDTFTASLIMNIFKKVNKQNQDKMRKMKVTQLANAAYKLSGMKEEVELDEAFKAGDTVKVKLNRKGKEYIEKGKVIKIEKDSIIVKHDFSRTPSKVSMKNIVKEEVDLDEGKMSQLHQYIKDKKSPEEIAKLMKLDVKTIKALMSSHHPEEVEESAASDARRAMSKDKDLRRGKDSADVDDNATDDDVKGASKNIMMQMRKAQSLNGRFDVEFADKKKVKIPAKMAIAVQQKYNAMRKPSDKEAFQSKVGKSYRDMLNALKEEAVSPAQQAAIAISKKERGEKPKKESILDRIDRKIKENKNG